jgi:hypothetical protein
MCKFVFTGTFENGFSWVNAEGVTGGRFIVAEASY